MVFKTWLTGLNDVQKAINNISTLSTTANGATHLFSNSAVVQQYASALNGLNKEQALLALSYKNLSAQQKEQILAQMGLIASENTIQSELLQTTLTQKGVSAEKSKAILVELGLMNAETGELLVQKTCTKADLEAILAQKGITGAQAEGIISALGLTGANAGLTASFGLLGKAIWGVTKALLSNPITWVVAGLAGVVTVAYQCSQAIEEVETKAQELNDTFSTSKTEIEDYKTQIDDLYKVINDSGSSIEDVTTARQNLMTIQDQLIEKFGDEKDTIDLITDAINGQTDALNTLTEAQWQAAKNEFNESGFWNDVANGIDGYSSNIDRMLGEYEGYSVTIDMSEYGGTLFTEGYDEFKQMLMDDFGATISKSSTASLELSGSASEVQQKLLDIQEILKENSTYKPDDAFSDYLGGLERSAEDVINKYEDFYKQYVLYEEIFTNDTFTDSYKKINDAYADYQDAFATGDEESIKKAQDNFANILTQATEGVSDESVVDFFNDMYPDLQDEVGSWQFEINFTENTDGLKDDVSGYLSGLDGLYTYDLKNFSYDSATEEQKASYDGLISVARLYGLTIDQLIDKLVLMGLVQDEEYQRLVDKFGKENIAKIAPEDLTFAYQIENIGDMSFEELQAEINRLKDESQDPLKTDIFSSFSDTDFGTRIQHITDLFNEGSLSHKEYFDALQSEINSFDASNFTDSLEDMNKASAQFFVDSVQQSASGLSDLINSFDSGEMSISEYLEGYLAIGNTLSTLTDSLQENSAAWNENGDAISNAKNTALDETQSSLNNVMATIESYQDSIYSLEQIMTEAVTVGSDEFNAHANVIAQDLANIVANGGEMADEIANTLGTTTAEIAQSMTENISNQEIACQAIMANTNDAITDMSTSIGELFDNLGNAISNFKVDLSFGIKSIDWKSVDILGKEFNLPEIKFELGASGESLENIGSAISSFGKSVASNFAPQMIDFSDFHFGSTDAGKDRKYTPGSNLTKNYENALDKVKDSSKKASESAKDSFEETFDFFDRRVKVLDDSLSLLKSSLENVTGSFAKNQIIDAEVSVTEEKFKNYSDALNMYTEKANEALSKLPSDIAEKVKNGAVDLTTFIGSGNKQIVENIKDYEQWSDSIHECCSAIAELQQELEDLELSKFSNIIEDFSNQFDIREKGKDLIDQTKEWIESSGQLIGESFFGSQVEQSKKQLTLLEQEKEQLVNQMQSALASGRVKPGSEAWLSMIDSLSEVEGSIIDVKTELESLDTELQNLHWDNLDRVSDRFANISEEIGNLIGLIDDVDVSDKNGNWSAEGLTQLGLYAQEYEKAIYASQMYADEIDKLNQAYLNGEYSLLEYQERLASLTDEQWNNINASEEALDSIKQLNEQRVDEIVEGIEEEKEAYREVIDAQLELIDSTEDLIGKREELEGKSKTVTDLERQIAAMMNDETASTVAKRLKLEEELSEARKDLENTERKYSVEEQKKSLEQMYEDFEASKNSEIETLKASLENQEVLISQSFETVKQNASLIGQQIAQTATEHGVTVSNALISSWQSGENAIASYGTVLSAQSSAFIGNIIGVENEVWNLQEQANNTASSLAYMFGTRADTLVNELTSSYFAENNLKTMTDALHNSLSQTLEGGYNVNSLVSSLNAVANAANETASAYERMRNSQANVGFGSVIQTTANSIIDKLGSSKKFVIKYDNSTITAPMSEDEADSWLNKYAHGGNYYKVRAYSTGGLVSKDDNNPLNMIAKSVGEDTLVAVKDKEGILTKRQTDALMDLAPMLDGIGNLWNMPLVNTKFPEIVDRKSKPNIDIHYDSLVTINGDVNDTNHFMRQITGVVERQLDKSFSDFRKEVL